MPHNRNSPGALFLLQFIRLTTMFNLMLNDFIRSCVPYPSHCLAYITCCKLMLIFSLQQLLQFLFVHIHTATNRYTGYTWSISGVRTYWIIEIMIRKCCSGCVIKDYLNSSNIDSVTHLPNLPQQVADMLCPGQLKVPHVAKKTQFFFFIS